MAHKRTHQPIVTLKVDTDLKIETVSATGRNLQDAHEVANTIVSLTYPHGVTIERETSWEKLA